MMSYGDPPKPGKHQGDGPEPNNTSVDTHDRNRAGGTFRFRQYYVDPNARVLLRDGHPVELGSRAFDLLLTLLLSRGVLVTKDEIMRRVWPNTVVDECNLRFQMATLRNSLGSDRDIIKTIPGRGYFLANEDGMEQEPPPAAAKSPQSLTGRLTRRHFRQVTIPGTADPEILGKPTVVIIDDDSGSRDALQGLIESAGLNVETFGSTQAFLERPAANPPNCLVLDVFLPGQSGLELQLQLACAGVHVPIIFISGYADVHMSVQAMKAGAFEFLTKPIRHRELLDAVSHAIAFRPENEPG